MMDIVLSLEETTEHVTQHAMGTVMAHCASGLYAREAVAAVCDEINRLEGLLSRFLPDSDVSRINSSAGAMSEEVDCETFDLLARSIEFSCCFPGCFDITIAPLVNLWHQSRLSGSVPDEQDLQTGLSLVNYNDIVLDAPQNQAGLRRTGQAIDLGGIGKGLAGDRVNQVFKDYEISSAYSNLGGNVVALGSRPDGSSWRIGIQHPRQEGRLLGAVSVVDRSVVTSGDYQRYFIDSRGMRRHHILDLQSGYPVQSGLVSVSVVSCESLVADVLSTVLFVAGLEQGMTYLKQFPHSEAIFVDSALQVYLTDGLRSAFTPERGIDVTYVD